MLQNLAAHHSKKKTPKTEVDPRIVLFLKVGPIAKMFGNHWPEEKRR